MVGELHNRENDVQGVCADLTSGLVIPQNMHADSYVTKSGVVGSQMCQPVSLHFCVC